VTGRAAAALALLASAAAAEPGDPHLSTVPRTAAETARIEAALASPRDFTKPHPFEALPAGAATVRARRDADAFSQPAATLSFAQELEFKVGNGLFRKLWVSAPASTLASDGLGPLYNARACQNCHVKDGRGHAPEGPEDDAVSMLVRIALPGGTGPEIEGWIATRPHPAYGGQVQDFGIAGVPAEARVSVTWEEFEVALSGGETARLRRPDWRLEDAAYGEIGAEAMLSPRLAPPMIGLGLIEAIPAADILAGADPEDADGDGISGRAALLPSLEHDAPMLGRFGWKAGKPTIREQSAAAFSGDMGISSPLRPAASGDCTALQPKCLAAPAGAGEGETEIDAEAFGLVVFYSSNLGVPARRDVGEPEVLRGKRVFHETGCAACHRPAFVTHRLPDEPERSFQLIWPWSDFLLHDMGEDLADGFADPVFDLPLPERGHAAAAHPRRPEAVAFARRPGTFALVIDCAAGREIARLDAPLGRQFYGHGAFSADGARLYTTENDYEAASGVIGIWDAAAGYARIGEVPSGGIGPHDVKRLPDGRLAVANGGIATHPASGRAKLNLATMRPNLAILSAAGVVEAVLTLPEPLRLNSIRHLALRPDGLLAFAMQWKGDEAAAPPLLGLWRAGEPLRLLEAPAPLARRTRGYAGSVAFSGDGARLAFTAPRGGLALVFDAETGRFLDMIEALDICGVAPMGDGFLFTTGEGRLIGGMGAPSVEQLAWDNHLVPMTWS